MTSPIRALARLPKPAFELNTSSCVAATLTQTLCTRGNV